MFRVMVYPGIIKIESTTITIALSKGDEFTIRLRKNPFARVLLSEMKNFKIILIKFHLIPLLC